MTDTCSFLPICNLPDDALKLFFRITAWAETNKRNNPNSRLRCWVKASKRFKTISVHKPKGKEIFAPPTNMEANFLYIPKSYSGKDVFRELRNAYCHNGIQYSKNGYFEIRPNNLIHIGGKFTLTALIEFTEAFNNSYTESK